MSETTKKTGTIHITTSEKKPKQASQLIELKRATKLSIFTSLFKILNQDNNILLIKIIYLSIAKS
jgi:hypothetical protein